MAGNEEIAQKEKKKQPMVMPTEIEVLVVNMDKVLYEDKAKSLIAPGPFGDFAVLPGHTPLFTKLIKGKLVVEGVNKNEEIEIEGGIARITQDTVKILVGF